MTFWPWSEEPALPPGAPEKAPPAPKKSWWEQGLERLKETGGITMPWQAEHWENQPAWTRHLGKAGLGLGLAAGGAALGGVGIPAGLSALSGVAPWLTGPALAAMAHPTALGAIGGIGGLMGSSMMAPGGIGEPPPSGVPGVPTGPPAPVVPPTTPPVLPQPGELPEAGLPTGEPQVIEVGGQSFWWNPTGGMYGTGGWDLIPARAPMGLTPEQQIAQTEEQRAHQIEMLKMQYGLEQQAMGAQAGYGRQQQAEAAQQQMQQMFSADPYKYWAQMGRGTPEAVARLTGGEIGVGEAFEHTPMSTPSAQWWGNLLPSEQQQVAGGLNWMGIDPQDWYSMYQRMIPGMGSRQMGPVWAR